MLNFPHIDGTTRAVKERTRTQIFLYCKKYYGDCFFNKYEYIGNQRISPNNGNIYADFRNVKENYIVSLYLCDYNDYINEVQKNDY